jgi:hypothetical protein
MALVTSREVGPILT